LPALLIKILQHMLSFLPRSLAATA
jgi:hypothetical protein